MPSSEHTFEASADVYCPKCGTTVRWAEEEIERLRIELQDAVDEIRELQELRDVD